MTVNLLKFVNLLDFFKFRKEYDNLRSSLVKLEPLAKLEEHSDTISWETPSVKWPLLALSLSPWCVLFTGIKSTRTFGEHFIWVDTEEKNFLEWKAVAVTFATHSD